LASPIVQFGNGESGLTQLLGRRAIGLVRDEGPKGPLPEREVALHGDSGVLARCKPGCVA
jgi:hypothetical protein